ncbi:MAG: toprim domain-containing protein [Alphaproteobacteria bacterium]|nr:toprim domain-containing protein [Alphaproteobacteria bacterium]
MTAQEIPIKDIVARLNTRMDELAVRLLGRPNDALSTANQLRYGRKGSLAVEIDGEKVGTWFDHEEGVGGDALSLIKKQCGLHNGAALDWAREWLGLTAPKKGENHVETREFILPSEMEAVEKENADASQNDSPCPSPSAEDRTAKVATIISKCTSLEGTPGQFYLRRRGITVLPPDCIRFRPFACGGYGALVALATDDQGDVLAVQQIYLTNDGKKAPVDVVKRTNKAVDGWASKAAVRFPGTQPVILTEGVETGLSVWQATGQETWACLGLSNIARAPLPDRASVIIARDGDIPGSKADNQLARAVSKLQMRGLAVAVATPPEGQDFNDLLLFGGEGTVRTLIAGAAFSFPQDDAFNVRTVYIGSDIEIAGRVREDLIDRYGPVLYAEGSFWRYGKTQWEPIEEQELRLCVHAYDGAPYQTPRGEKARVKLSKGRVDSVLNELMVVLKKEDFFADAPSGINCASGFIRFVESGAPILEPHSRDHRCRHTLPGRWSPFADVVPPESSMLYRLLDGSFKDDEDKADKIQLFGEVVASAAMGYATKVMHPAALVLEGKPADNGKSQYLDLPRGMLPSSAICSVSAARMGDERHVIALAGKLLNASDELSSSKAISSDTFKAIITGEPVDGRDVYKSRVEFRPVAQHIFATNVLPPFQGGMDRGVQRRLMVLTFNRVIPYEERIEGIGRRIAAEEADLLLAWVVGCASRLIRQRRFTLPASSKRALSEWILGADPVLAWIDECVEIRANDPMTAAMPTRTAYIAFYNWAVAEGYKHDKLPAINGFVQRIQANATGVESKRTSTGRVFLGLRLKHMTQV